MQTFRFTLSHWHTGARPITLRSEFSLLTLTRTAWSLRMGQMPATMPSVSTSVRGPEVPTMSRELMTTLSQLAQSMNSSARLRERRHSLSRTRSYLPLLCVGQGLPASNCPSHLKPDGQSCSIRTSRLCFSAVIPISCSMSRRQQEILPKRNLLNSGSMLSTKLG